MEQTELLDISKFNNNDNVAELLDEQVIHNIAEEVIKGYKVDKESTSDWHEMLKETEEVVKQTLETKDSPFPGASNVKFPAITLAAVDFGSRLYTELIQGTEVVKFATAGKSEQEYKLERSERLSALHNYQLLYENKDWEAHTDKLGYAVPICGTVFKKVYFDPDEEMPRSEFCSPRNIVINMNTSSIENAIRVSHLIEYSNNDIVQRIRQGSFLDIDVNQLDGSYSEKIDNFDPDKKHCFIEQHFYYDLDQDGYKEPYIAVVHLGSSKLLGLYSRIDEIKKNKKTKQIIKIKPINHFVDYHFLRIPEADNGFYSTGYGTLMLGLNEAINTIINNLIDAGTLSNSPCGYFNQSIRIKNKDMTVEPGEFKAVQTGPGTKLADNIYNLPFNEPSQTLFALLGLLVDVSKDLTSINDVMQGKQALTHVSPNSMSKLIDQGMKVYNAINKRMYNSFKKEFELIYNLNRKYLSEEKYQEIIDDPKANKELDFKVKGYDVCPVMDPSLSAKAMKLAQAETLMNDPMAAPMPVRKFYYKALGVPDELLEEAFPTPDPNAPPSLEEQLQSAEIEVKQKEIAKLEAEIQEIYSKIDSEAMKIGIMDKEVNSKIQGQIEESQRKNSSEIVSQAKAASDEQFKQMEMRLKVIDQFIKSKKQSMDEIKVISEVIKEDNGDKQ